MPKIVWTEQHAERARELARLGWSDRDIALEILVSRNCLLYHRLGLNKLRPAKPIAQQRPLNGWTARALEMARAELDRQIAIAKIEAADPKTPLFKGRRND
jgi:hypothetical protein